MIVVELALQGIKGFPELVRLRMKPGLNVARPSDRALGTALFDAFYHTLFPDPSRHNATAHLVMSRADRSRAALTFFGRDRVTYRLIREADSGAIKLYKFEQATKQYKLFTDAAKDAANYVRVQQHLPDEVSYERLFVFSPESMPSRKERARTKSGAPLMSFMAAAPSAPGMPAMQHHHLSGVMARPESALGAAPPRALSQMSGVMPGTFGSSLNVTNALVQSELAESDSMRPEPEKSNEVSKEEAQAELAKLRSQLDTQVRAERAQDEIDQLNHRRFELTEKVERVTRAKAELEHYEREAPTGDLANLPAGFTDRLRHYEELQAKYADDRAKLDDELIALEHEERNAAVLPLSKDPYFLGGIAGVVGFLVLAGSLAAPLIALVNVACALVAGGAALRFVSDLEGRAKRAARQAATKDRVGRLEKQHNLDTGATRRLMAKLEVDSPAELLERLEAQEQVQHQRAIAQETLASLMRDPELQSATVELTAIERRLEALEADVMAGSGALLSVDTLNRRIDRLADQLGIERPAPPPPRSSSIVGTPGSPPPPERSGSIVGTPVPGGAPPRSVSGVGRPVMGTPARGTSTAGTPLPGASGTGDLHAPPRGASGINAPPRGASGISAPPRGASGINAPPRGASGINAPPRGGGAPVARGSSGVRVPRPRGASIVGTPASPPTRDLPLRGTGDVPAYSTDDLGQMRSDDLAEVRNTGDFDNPDPLSQRPTESGKLPAFPSSPPLATPDIASDVPELRTAPPRTFSTFVTPIDPREFSQTAEQTPEDPLAREPSLITRAYPGEPPAPKPAPPANTAAHSLFDFGGGDLVGDDDDDEDGYGSGYGGSGGGGGGSGGQSASGEGGYHASGFGGPGGGYGGVGAYDGSGPAAVADRSRDLMQAAVDVLQRQVDDLGSAIERRLGQYLVAFTDGHFRTASFGPRGEVTVHTKDEAESAAYVELDGEQLDLVDAALRFCLVETIVRERRIPVLFDDPFTHFSDKKRKLLAQMLAYLGGATQVFVTTSKDDIAGHPLEW